VSQPEQKRFLSGTTPGTMLAMGSMGGSAGRASGRLPSWRVAALPLRVEPDRVDRVDRVLRPLRVEGVRPDPVRVEGVARTRPLTVFASALPQTLQYPSSMTPAHPACPQAAAAPDVAVVVAVVAAGAGRGEPALPQTLQYPSSSAPVHAGSTHFAMRKRITPMGAFRPSGLRRRSRLRCGHRARP
jgi:hypothetical protein